MKKVKLHFTTVNEIGNFYLFSLSFFTINHTAIFGIFFAID